MAQKIFFCNKKQKMWHIRILVLLWWWFDSAFITLIIHFIGGHVVFERSVFSKFSDNHFFQVWMKKWLCILLAFCWYALTLHMDGWCWFVKLQFSRENRKKRFYLGGIQNLFFKKEIVKCFDNTYFQSTISVFQILTQFGRSGLKDMLP